MRRRDALSLIGVAGGGVAGGLALAGNEAGNEKVYAATSPQDQLIGVWQVVKQYTVGKDGSETIVSPRQRGHISWDRSGRVWVLLFNDGRKTPANPRMPTVEEYREMNSGIVSYYGTYSIDEVAKTVTHHLEASVGTSLLGTPLTRFYEFSGNRLDLRFPGDGQRHIVFERLPDSK